MKVTIIVTTYNYGKYLKRCLDSCLKQNFRLEDYEVIVVDDCSTDNTHELMQVYASNPQVKYVQNRSNLGVAGSANQAIRLAKGEYVVRVDADDFVSPNFILFLYEYLQTNSNAFCVSCDYVYVSDQEEHLERISSKEKPVSCGILYPRKALFEYGMYNEEWRHREEEELRKRLGKLYMIHHLSIPLYFYRMHKSNKTKNLDMMENFRHKLKEIESAESLELNLDLPPPDYAKLTDNVVVIIPARGGSQRLNKKNIYPLLNKPLLAWSIEAAKQSKYVRKVYVTTEDNEIAEVAKEYGAGVVKRPLKLSEGLVYKQDAICHAVHEISQQDGRPTLIVSLQANSPEVKGKDIDEGIELLLSQNKQEVMSVDENLCQNAAIRIMTYNAVFQKTLSTNFAVFITDLLDVHYLEDLKEIERRNNFVDLQKISTETTR